MITRPDHYEEVDFIVRRLLVLRIVLRVPLEPTGAKKQMGVSAVHEVRKGDRKSKYCIIKTEYTLHTLETIGR